jgi:hypothetical protein
MDDVRCHSSDVIHCADPVLLYCRLPRVSIMLIMTPSKPPQDRSVQLLELTFVVLNCVNVAVDRGLPTKEDWPAGEG